MGNYIPLKTMMLSPRDPDVLSIAAISGDLSRAGFRSTDNPDIWEKPYRVEGKEYQLVIGYNKHGVGLVQSGELKARVYYLANLNAVELAEDQKNKDAKAYEQSLDDLLPIFKIPVER